MYKTRHWRALRKKVLNEEPLCRLCQMRGRDSEATVADHIVPHRGDQSVFFDINNIQPLCKPCHDRVKQREEKRGYTASLDADGWPIDPAHPSNRSG